MPFLKYLPSARGPRYQFLQSASALLIGTFLLGLTTGLAADKKDAGQNKNPPIREFDIATLSRLGREIYLHDQLAWKATDVVMAQIGMARLKKDGSRGWIVDATDPKRQIVRFLRLGNAGLEVLCDIIFVPGGAPALEVPDNRALTAKQRDRAEALETAKKRFTQGDLMWCGGNPNTVVLDDPDGSGYLVYFLRANPAADQVPIGGHYRFTVSADGKKVEQVDRLFASCLTMKKEHSKGSPVALYMSHVVSPTPLETHVFLSLQEGIPFMVGTMDSVVWSIENGEIKQMGAMEDLRKQQK